MTVGSWSQATQIKCSVICECVFSNLNDDRFSTYCFLGGIEQTSSVPKIKFYVGYN
jgi:hypothetical protein